MPMPDLAASWPWDVRPLTGQLLDPPFTGGPITDPRRRPDKLTKLVLHRRPIRGH